MNQTMNLKKHDKAQIRKERISATLNKIIDLFKTGNVPKAIAIVTFPPFDVPSNDWSLANRLIMMKSDTSDARGYKMWQEVGRYPKKGAKAFYILAPMMVKKKPKDNTKEQENIEYILRGFVPVAVFSAEDTQGESLEYEKIKLPDLPLIEKAHKWGIDVAAIAFQGKCYGFYQDGFKEKIRLATPHESVFFHELSHGAHRRIRGKLQPGQDPQQEIVAELSAQVLAQLVGTEIHSTLGNSYEYIRQYSERMGKSVELSCISVLSEVEKVLKLILDEEDGR